MVWVASMSEPSTTSATTQIAGMTGTYLVCSKGVLGKFALQLDVQMDDGQPCTGSMRAVADGAAMGAAAISNTVAPPAGIDDAANYTVCMTF